MPSLCDKAGHKQGESEIAVAPKPLEIQDDTEEVTLPRRFGRYNLLKVLARGGMGRLYLASTTGVEGAERPVVVKLIRQEYARDPNFMARFLDEARVQAQLHHSGVAQVLEAAKYGDGGDPYVVIEYVEGRSLGEIRRRIADVNYRLAWEEAVAISILVAESLGQIHARRDAAGKPLQIVHRDLSPHNLMVGYAGEVKVIDFGTARGQNRRCHTVAGVVFAKPGYVAPEVANGDSGDARVDMYAAGVMLWELCTGRRFLQGDPQEHMAAVARGEHDLPPIASLAGAPVELDAVIAKMTAHRRGRRYKDCRQAATQLASLLRSASPLPNGARSVRARVAQLMYNLYPAEPGRARRTFARLVAKCRKRLPDPWPTETAIAQDLTADGSELLAGTRYRLGREIGRGASSVVYEGEHVDLGRRVAVKLLDAEHTHSRDFAARFRREARALSRLQHPGLVKVHDFGQTDEGRMFYVMELLEGHTLRAALDEGERFGWKRALRIARQACLAMHMAHDRGVIHRDIKPANLFLTKQGQVKLIDFGLAKSADEVPEPTLAHGPSAQLGAMTLFGTPEYMAPEQVAGGRLDGRADIYALGCALYEMLAGRLPFMASSSVGLLDAKLKGNPEPLTERVSNRGIPRFVNRLVMKALARHPSRRFGDAALMAEAISEALDEPTRRRGRRRAVGASLVAACMAFSFMLLGQQARPWLETLPAKVPWLSPSTVEPSGDEQPADDESTESLPGSVREAAVNKASRGERAAVRVRLNPIVIGAPSKRGR